MATVSVESAIKSLEQSEYFIPICPIAIPSHTAIAGNTTGVPPASATPSFTASDILSKFICPGTISLNELTIPIIGFLISSGVIPTAFKSDLLGACCIPDFILFERKFSIFPLSITICFCEIILYIQLSCHPSERC